MKRASPWLAAIFFAGCVVLSVLLVDLRAELARAAAARGDLEQTAQRQTADLQSQLVRLKDDQVKAVKKIAQLQQDSSAVRTATNNGENGPSGTRIIHISDILKDHPEFAALNNHDQRRGVLRQYGDAINRLNLPPDQAAKLKDLLVERQMSSTDAQQAAEAAGFERGTADWAKAIQQASQDAEQGITALLGPGGPKTLQQLSMSSMYANQIQMSYAPDLTDAGVPLSADQASALADAMASANAHPQQGPRPDPSSDLSPSQQRMIDAASQVLTSAQFQVFKNDQIEQAQRNAIMKQYTQGSNGGYMLLP